MGSASRNNSTRWSRTGWQVVGDNDEEAALHCATPGDHPDARSAANRLTSKRGGSTVFQTVSELRPVRTVYDRPVMLARWGNLLIRAGCPATTSISAGSSPTTSRAASGASSPSSIRLSSRRRPSAGRTRCSRSTRSRAGSSNAHQVLGKGWFLFDADTSTRPIPDPALVGVRPASSLMRVKKLQGRLHDRLALGVLSQGLVTAAGGNGPPAGGAEAPPPSPRSGYARSGCRRELRALSSHRRLRPIICWSASRPQILSP